MPHLRLCRALRWKEYTGYGLTIMVGSISPPKAGHYINAVEPNSPAEAAGLKAGDRILAINNQRVADPMTHSEVMAKAKTDPNQVFVLYQIITHWIIFGRWSYNFQGRYCQTLELLLIHFMAVKYFVVIHPVKSKRD